MEHYRSKSGISILASSFELRRSRALIYHGAEQQRGFNAERSNDEFERVFRGRRPHKGRSGSWSSKRWIEKTSLQSMLNNIILSRKMTIRADIDLWSILTTFLMRWFVLRGEETLDVMKRQRILIKDGLRLWLGQLL